MTFKWVDEEDQLFFAENADDKHWRGRTTGAVWNGELGMLPGPFRGSHGKEIEYEEIQPSLVAARHHSARGGGRLQELRQFGWQLWATGNECLAVWRSAGRRPDRRRGCDGVHPGWCNAGLPRWVRIHRCTRHVGRLGLPVF